jgi:hypothetical protein
MTFTVNTQVETLPFTSVAVNVFVVIPVPNTDPEAKPEVRTTDSSPQLSCAAGME